MWDRSKARYIQVRDSDGKRHAISREQFAEELLHEILFEAYNKPRELQDVILQALEDGFAERLDDAARRLCSVSYKPLDAVLLRALVLAEAGKFQQAVEVLEAYEAVNGFDPRTHGCLAEMQWTAGNKSVVYPMIRRVLTTDPNLFAALVFWLEALMGDESEQLRLDGLSELSRVQGAWLPQVWLALHKLATGGTITPVQTIERYIDQIASEPQVLQVVARSLIDAQQPIPVLELIYPRFEVDRDLPDTAIAVLIALLHYGREAEARDLLRMLWNRWPEGWREYLKDIYDRVYRVPWWKTMWRKLRHMLSK